MGLQIGIIRKKLMYGTNLIALLGVLKMGIKKGMNKWHLRQIRLPSGRFGSFRIRRRKRW